MLFPGISTCWLNITCSFPPWNWGLVLTNSTVNLPTGDPFIGSSNFTLRLSLGINCIEGFETKITDDEGFGTDTRAASDIVVGAIKVINWFWS